jgi:hypothetical protein
MPIHSVKLYALVGLIVTAVSIACVGLSSTSCISPDRLDRSPAIAQQTPALFTGLPQPARLASESGDFLPFRDGSDYAADLANNRCAAASMAAVFTPDYTAPHRALSDAAYGLYRLELDPAATSATLSLVWNGAAPAKSECWVGLSNWERGAWDWMPLTGNDLELSDPSLYAGSEKHCYIALVVLGNTQVTLVSISFGPLPLPPPDDGYTLFAPMADTTTYLIDHAGAVVHTWVDQYPPGASVCLSEDGYLWRQDKLTNTAFAFGGQGGRIEKVDWDGNVVWAYELSTTTQCTHHDFELLPNGNVLLIVWNRYTPEQAIALGRDPAIIPNTGILIDSIYEVAPAQLEPAIVWQWNAFEHLVQNFDSDKPNYGNPAEHPELIDFNYYAFPSEDWTHVNSVDYNAELDQIVIDPLVHSEFWVIDHSTTMQEAAGHTGGRYGHGGDLLYRWGNPCAYGAGSPADRKLWGQHNVHWIEQGLKGAGDLMVFNNMAGTLDGMAYSTVLEITPPLNPDGSYYMTGAAYGPEDPVWRYRGDPPGKFFGVNMSSAQRLPNGDTLICCGPDGRMFEATPGGGIVWDYQNQFPTLGTTVFRVIRYPVDYPGLVKITP